MALVIPPAQLAAETLQRLLEDFVTRDGTDNGDESTLDERVQRVRQALTAGQVFIVYDEVSEQCGLLSRQEIPHELLDD